MCAERKNHMQALAVSVRWHMAFFMPTEPLRSGIFFAGRWRVPSRMQAVIVCIFAKSARKLYVP